MLKRLIAFIKSRPTEVWLGLWTAVVAVLVNVFGVDIQAGVTAAISAVIGWLTTFVASKDSNSLGPQPS